MGNDVNGMKYCGTGNTDLQVTLRVEKQVLGLDVPVHDAVPVQHGESGDLGANGESRAWRIRKDGYERSLHT